MDSHTYHGRPGKLVSERCSLCVGCFVVFLYTLCVSGPYIDRTLSPSPEPLPEAPEFVYIRPGNVDRLSERLYTIENMDPTISKCVDYVTVTAE
jgi:hypothetical protein